MPKEAVMSKKITNDEDIQESADSFESQGGKNLKIPEGKTPVYFLSEDYADGYVHWVTLPDGGRKRLVCLGGLEGKGWQPDDCPICGLVARLYKTAKDAEKKDGETSGVRALRKRAGGLRAKYEAHFLVAKGEMVKEKNKEGRKVFVPDFEDSTVGILSMTKQQYELFTGLRSNESYPFMKGAPDLVNRIIVLDKAKRGESNFATTEFIPARAKSDPPEVEYDADDFDLEEDFVVEEEEVSSAAELLDTEDFDNEMETDDAEEAQVKSKHPSKKEKEEVGEDFFDSEDEDDAADEEEAVGEFKDDFEDDDPAESVVKKPTSKKSAPKPQPKASAKKAPVRNTKTQVRKRK
jgi:hypothetical protein